MTQIIVVTECIYITNAFTDYSTCVYSDIDTDVQCSSKLGDYTCVYSHCTPLDVHDFNVPTITDHVPPKTEPLSVADLGT